MKNTGSLKVATPTDREIVMTRVFEAPRRLVWDAMTKPDLIRRWLYCPEGWTMTRCEEDLRVGGAFLWEWNGPDGNVAMTMRGVYREVSPPERVVRTEAFELGCQGHLGEQLATIVLTEHPRDRAKTTATITVLLPSKEARDAMIASGMEHGVSTGYDRLERLLADGSVSESEARARAR